MMQGGGGGAPPQQFPGVPQQGYVAMPQGQGMVPVYGMTAPPTSGGAPQMAPPNQGMYVPAAPVQMWSGRNFYQQPAMWSGRNFYQQPAMWSGRNFYQQPAAGYVAGPGAVYQMGQQQRFMPQPPSYTPDMAQQFRTRQGVSSKQQQRMVEDHKKRVEQEAKHRQFQEQQKKLKDFGTMAGRKVDASKMIESIMGKPDPKPVTTKAAPQEEAFGDFMSVSAPVAAPVATPTTDPPVAIGNQPDTPQPAPIPTPKDDGKDLASMMMECSDLSAPQKAKSFHIKRKVSEMQPTKVKAASFSTSQKSRQWGSNNTDTLNELFTLPAPAVAAPQPQVAQTGVAMPPHPVAQTPPQFVMPKWCSGEAPAPDVYKHVLEASVKDGQIVTEVVYGILIRSGLPKEMLAAIWGLCNRATPGQLNQQELYLILAMVSVAQNNLSIQSLDILNRCPQAPVPNLGQAGQPPSQPPPPSQPLPPQQPSTQGLPPPAPPSTGLVPSPPGYSALPIPSVPSLAAGVDVGITNGSDVADDFSDFQAGPPAALSQPSDANDFGTFKSVPAAPATLDASPVGFGIISPPKVAPPKSDLLGAEDRYAFLTGFSTDVDSTGVGMLDTLTTVPEADQQIEFEDFQSAPPASAFIPEPVLVKPTTIKLTRARATPSPDYVRPSSRSDIKDAVFPVLGEAFRSPSRETTPDRPIDTFSNISSPSVEPEPSFAAAAISSNNINSETSKTGDDKYSALKSLISNSALFSVKPKPMETDLDKVDDDWNFLSASNNADEGSVSTAVEAVTDDDWFGNASEHKDVGGSEGEAGWADFSSAVPAPVATEKPTPTPAVIDWAAGLPLKPETSVVSPDEDEFGDFASNNNVTETKTKSTSVGKKAKMEPVKANRFWGRNLEGVDVAAGTGISPLDVLPPDMPDMKEEEDEENFDKFGTFQNNASDLFSEDKMGSDGISSLVTPYGGLDDLAEPVSSGNAQNRYGLQNMFGGGVVTGTSKTLTANKDNSDATSTSSLEFTGWKGPGKVDKEDTQSMNSLDFISKDVSGTPSGDSQSVSSMEIGGDGVKQDSSATDIQSVASLELKAAEPAVVPQQNGRTPSPAADGDHFPGFPMAATTLDLSARPRDITEVLAQGDLPNLGDRYTGFSSEPQDLDRHIHHWQRCLQKCYEMIEEAYHVISTVSTSSVCREIIKSKKGSEYLIGVVEIYRVVCRIRQSIRSVSLSNSLEEVVGDTEGAWASLTVFLADTTIMPEGRTLDFSRCVLKADDNEAQQRACGVCLLDVDAHARIPADDKKSHKLTYGGRQYHTTCSNFWVNCVDSTLPALCIPELL